MKAHIVITGASSGIGEALALRYAAPGMLLSLTGRNRERLMQVKEACADKGATVEAAALDVTEDRAIKDWLEARDTLRPVDILFANAGISGGTGGNTHGEKVGQVRSIFAVNLKGVLNTIDPLLPRMMERGQGQIALMSSLAGFRGFPGAPAYCASKAAVKVYGEAMRGAIAGTGVRVNVICPGFVKSRMTDANGYAMPFMISAEKAADIIARGLAKNKGRIAFPLPTHFLVWAMSVLPDGLVQRLLRKLPTKPEQG